MLSMTMLGLLCLTTKLLFDFPNYIFYLLIITGFTGSIFDSLLGATVQGKYLNKYNSITENSNDNRLYSGFKIIDNSLVNLLNTIFSPIFFFIVNSFF